LYHNFTSAAHEYTNEIFLKNINYYWVIFEV